MKFALCETALGWVGIGIEEGAICATTLPTTREHARRAMLEAGASEAAGKRESARLRSLVRRAAEGKPVDANRQILITRGTPFQRAVCRPQRGRSARRSATIPCPSSSRVTGCSPAMAAWAASAAV
jgi:hypothetical protein